MISDTRLMEIEKEYYDNSPESYDVRELVAEVRRLSKKVAEHVLTIESDETDYRILQDEVQQLRGFDGKFHNMERIAQELQDDNAELKEEIKTLREQLLETEPACAYCGHTRQQHLMDEEFPFNTDCQVCSCLFYCTKSDHKMAQEANESLERGLEDAAEGRVTEMPENEFQSDESYIATLEQENAQLDEAFINARQEWANQVAHLSNELKQVCGELADANARLKEVEQVVSQAAQQNIEQLEEAMAEVARLQACIGEPGKRPVALAILQDGIPETSIASDTNLGAQLAVKTVNELKAKIAKLEDTFELDSWKWKATELAKWIQGFFGPTKDTIEALARDILHPSEEKVESNPQCACEHRLSDHVAELPCPNRVCRECLCTDFVNVNETEVREDHVACPVCGPCELCEKYGHRPNAETIAALEESEAGGLKQFNNLDDLLADLDSTIDEIKDDVADRGKIAREQYLATVAEAEDTKHELLKAQSTIQKLSDALDFYANPLTYTAIGFLNDPPCGAFADDFSDCGIHGWKPGKTAREVFDGPVGDTVIGNPYNNTVECMAVIGANAAKKFDIDNDHDDKLSQKRRDAIVNAIRSAKVKEE